MHFKFSDIWLVTKISRLGLYKILEQLEVKGLKVSQMVMSIVYYC